MPPFCLLIQIQVDSDIFDIHSLYASSEIQNVSDHPVRRLYGACRFRRCICARGSKTLFEIVSLHHKHYFN